MSNLSKINTETDWLTACNTINENNSKISADIEKLKSSTTKNKGYFKTLEDLSAAFTSVNSSVGMIAYVGTASPYKIYEYTSSGWSDTGNTYSPQVNLGEYYDKETMDSLLSNKFDVSNIVQTTGGSATTAMSQKATTEKLTELEDKGSEGSIKLCNGGLFITYMLQNKTVYADKDGLFSDSNGVTCTQYIAGFGETIKILGADDFLVAIAQYDGDKKWISTSYYSETYFYTINGAYFRIGFRKKDSKITSIQDVIESNIQVLRWQNHDSILINANGFTLTEYYNGYILDLNNANLYCNINGKEYNAYSLTRKFIIEKDKNRYVMYNPYTSDIYILNSDEITHSGSRAVYSQEQIPLLIILSKKRGFGVGYLNSIIPGNSKYLGSKTYTTNLKVVRGARYTSSYPSISTTNKRCATEGIIDLSDYTYAKISIDVPGYTIGCVTSDSPNNNNNVSDSGWLSDTSEIEIHGGEKYVCFNIKKDSDGDFSDEDMTLLNNQGIEITIEGDTLIDSDGDYQVLSKYAESNFINRTSFLVINHASNGYSGHTSNTELSTVTACQNGYDCIENDIRMTSDNIPILFHDNQIKLGEGLVDISTLTYDEIKDYKYSDGQGICKLETQLQICKNHNVKLVAELKSNSTKTAMTEWTKDKFDIVIDMLNKYLGYQNYVLQSFSEDLISKIRHYNKKITLGCISYRDTTMPSVDIMKLSCGNTYACVDYGAAVADNDSLGYNSYLQNMKNNGITIIYWTPTMLDCARAANDNVCSGVITNTYIDKIKNVMYINSDFTKDDILSYNGSLSGDGISLSDGQIVSIVVPQKIGATVVEITFIGTLRVESLDRGYGQDSGLYPTGILHPDQDVFQGGSYVFGINNGARLSNNVLTFTSVGESIISNMFISINRKNV